VTWSTNWHRWNPAPHLNNHPGYSASGMLAKCVKAVVLTTLLTSVTNQSTLTSSFHQSLTSNPKPILSRRPPSKLHSPDDDLQTHWPLFDLQLISNLLFHRSTCQTPNPSLLETSTKKNLRWTAPFQKFQGIGEATSLVSHSRGPKILRSNKIVPGVWVW
jgi:hypothetical protein